MPNTPVLCIDFGSAFTKVGLRHDPDKLSELLTDASHDFAFDDDRFCLPSVIAANLPGASPPWLFGMAAVDCDPKLGYKVYRNWKPKLFAPEEAKARESSPALVTPPTPEPASKASRFLCLLDEQRRRRGLLDELATEFGLEPAWVGAQAESQGMTNEDLEQCLRRRQPVAVAAPGRLSASPSAPPQTRNSTPSSTPGTINLGVREAALNYFTWLRGFVRAACLRLKGDELASARTRFCVPAFPETDGAWSEELKDYLCELLSAAGWVMHEKHPILTEPVANAIGVLTGGRNTRWVPPRQTESEPSIHMEGMFKRGSILSALAGRQPQAVVLIIDVGAFTTDFAMVQVRPADGQVPWHVRSHSERLGVADLDRRVIERLPAGLGATIAGLDFRKQETFRQTVYVRNRTWKASAREAIDRHGLVLVQKAIEEFAADSCARLDEFIKEAPGTIDELVLTGGGNNLPGLRDFYLEHLKRPGLKRIHLPDSARSPQETSERHPLGQRHVRGGSALGGTSLFFDQYPD